MENHKAERCLGGLDCRNSGAKENKTNLQGFAEQKEALIRSGITHGQNITKFKVSCKSACFVLLWHRGCMRVCEMWLCALGPE